MSLEEDNNILKNHWFRLGAASVLASVLHDNESHRLTIEDAVCFVSNELALKPKDIMIGYDKFIVCLYEKIKDRYGVLKEEAYKSTLASIIEELRILSYDEALEELNKAYEAFPSAFVIFDTCIKIIKKHLNVPKVEIV